MKVVLQMNVINDFALIRERTQTNFTDPYFSPIKHHPRLARTTTGNEYIPHNL